MVTRIPVSGKLGLVTGVLEVVCATKKTGSRGKNICAAAAARFNDDSDQVIVLSFTNTQGALDVLDLQA